MKTAFIKQRLNLSGPWKNVPFEGSKPVDLFQVWPGRVMHWEATQLLQGDWYIMEDPPENSDYISGIRKQERTVRLVENFCTEALPAKQIPFESYDLVISLDPILNVSRLSSRTLFAYYCEEHWDRMYAQSFQKPMKRYDLFLDHMLDAPWEVSQIPQSLAFPYLRSPEIMREVIANRLTKEETVWADFRTLSALGMIEGGDESILLSAARRLEQALGIPVRTKIDLTPVPSHILDTPSWGDPLRYLEAMAKSKYYVGVGRPNGAGQGLGDAASLGLVCIGDSHRPYHRLICHPECLCRHLEEIPDVFSFVMKSRDLQREAVAWQDQRLKKYFQELPLAQIEAALSMKRKAAGETSAN